MGYLLHACGFCSGDLWPDPDGDGYVCSMCARTYHHKRADAPMPHVKAHELTRRIGPTWNRSGPRVAKPA